MKVNSTNPIFIARVGLIPEPAVFPLSAASQRHSFFFALFLISFCIVFSSARSLLPNIQLTPNIDCSELFGQTIACR